jgi:hypothetical protein
MTDTNINGQKKRQTYLKVKSTLGDTVTIRFLQLILWITEKPQLIGNIVTAMIST